MSAVSERHDAISVIANDMISDLFPTLAEYDKFYSIKRRHLLHGRYMARVMMPRLVSLEAARFRKYDDLQLFDELQKVELKEDITQLGVAVGCHALNTVCGSSWLPSNQDRHVLKKVSPGMDGSEIAAVDFVEASWAPSYAARFVEARFGLQREAI